MEFGKYVCLTLLGHACVIIIVPLTLIKKKIVFIFETKIANHYTMESSSSKGECPSVFNVEMTQKEALRKAADPLASVGVQKALQAPSNKAKQDL